MADFLGPREVCQVAQCLSLNTPLSAHLLICSWKLNSRHFGIHNNPCIISPPPCLSSLFALGLSYPAKSFPAMSYQVTSCPVTRHCLANHVLSCHPHLVMPSLLQVVCLKAMRPTVKVPVRFLVGVIPRIAVHQPMPNESISWPIDCIAF